MDEFTKKVAEMRDAQVRHQYAASRGLMEKNRLFLLKAELELDVDRMLKELVPQPAQATQSGLFGG